MIKERKLSKESLLKKYKKMCGSFGEAGVAMIKDFDVDKIRRIVNRFEMYSIEIDNNKKDLDYSDFRKFPKRVQKEIIYVLRTYNECNVSFEFGKWEVSPDSWIKSSYAKDHRVFGTFYYDTLVGKVKGLKEEREKAHEESSKMFRNLPDSFWA